ncbi:MAG TPA: TrmH family RNA methyltransferase [Dongiaceae bacterium]|nr:TrmH family RNA methyltransferase [Dongiaceae bacterium]
MEPDTRNVIDKYRGQSVESIVANLDVSRSELEIAVENLERDFNMGTIVRNANAFNVHRVHIIGRRQWNKRGAMKTDAYLHIEYHPTVEEFIQSMQADGREVVAVDIVPGAKPLHEVKLPFRAVLVFGSEGPGLSSELLNHAAKVVMIEQFGSTRSINVGVASGIAMYAWVQQHLLTQ